jgi:hypothetical protein
MLRRNAYNIFAARPEMSYLGNDGVERVILQKILKKLSDCMFAMFNYSVASGEGSVVGFC